MSDDAALPTAGPTVRVVVVGDVMLGRGVAAAIDADGPEVFAEVRHLLGANDIAAANLESPLTFRPHQSDNPNALEADPALAQVLSVAGFDLVALANNHLGDTGPEGIGDTIAAAEAAAMLTVGAGGDAAAAAASQVFDVGGMRVGFLAYDVTDAGLSAGDEAGVSSWRSETAAPAIAELASSTDLVVVSLHGGTEYLPVNDPAMTEVAGLAASAGADVVWGHGAHVIQPITVLDGARPTVVATSLGNFLFDQVGADRTTGALLEVLADPDGVIAYRVGITEHADRRVHFVDWLSPSGDAALFDRSWWQLVQPPLLAPSSAVATPEFRHGDLIAAGAGDIDDNGADEIVASFRRPAEATPLNEWRSDLTWTDDRGRSAHLGVYRGDELSEVWVAGTVIEPIAALEVCDGSMALVHDRLDDTTPVATSAWTWNGFGFDAADLLDGGGTPGCADVNSDGRTEPIILRPSDDLGP
ncbi:MAG: CapA family protein [Acidimicrobiales bacterium]